MIDQHNKNYLTQGKLGTLLGEIFPDDEIIEDRAFKPYRFRPDFYLPDKKLVIEFDGYQHYTNSSIIVSDFKKDSILADLNIDVIRLPYFVQIDAYIIKLLFNKEYNKVSYPHGFIDKKAILPSDFCEMGISRFLNDLDKFSGIKTDIIQSLRTKIIQSGDSRVVIPDQIKNKFIEVFK